MISKEQVLHIAKLARIELTDQEVQNMQKDLSSILDYFNVLKKTKNQKPKTKITDQNLKIEQVTREDVGQENPASLANNLVAAAPDKKDGYFKVKAIL